MPRLLDRTPIPESSSETVVRGERVRLRANQIILWLTITPRLDRPPNPAAVRFPAILDTGHTHTLALQERHLVNWAGLWPDALPVSGAVRDRGRRVILRAATIWIYANQPESRDRLADRPPFRLRVSEGVAVYPSGVEFPRLPVLGLRAIVENALILKVVGLRREATLRTARRWWPFADG